MTSWKLLVTLPVEVPILTSIHSPESQRVRGRTGGVSGRTTGMIGLNLVFFFDWPSLSITGDDMGPCKPRTFEEGVSSLADEKLEYGIFPFNDVEDPEPPDFADEYFLPFPFVVSAATPDLYPPSVFIISEARLYTEPFRQRLFGNNDKNKTQRRTFCSVDYIHPRLGVLATHHLPT